MSSEAVTYKDILAFVEWAMSVDAEEFRAWALSACDGHIDGSYLAYTSKGGAMRCAMTSCFLENQFQREEFEARDQVHKLVCKDRLKVEES